LPYGEATGDKSSENLTRKGRPPTLSSHDTVLGVSMLRIKLILMASALVAVLSFWLANLIYSQPIQNPQQEVQYSAGPKSQTHPARIDSILNQLSELQKQRKALDDKANELRELLPKPTSSASGGASGPAPLPTTDIQPAARTSVPALPAISENTVPMSASAGPQPKAITPGDHGPSSASGHLADKLEIAVHPTNAYFVS
jgi:hypothetical protein